MELKGMDRLRAKLPGYPGKKIFILPLRGIISTILGYIFLVLIDIVPRLFPDTLLLALVEPLLPILGSLVIGALAIYLIAELWKKRDQMKAEYGILSYQMMIPKGVLGVFLIPPLVFHAATSIRSLPPGPPVNSLTTQLSQSLLPLLGIPTTFDIWIRLGLTGFFLIAGLLTVRSSVLTFGLDYMTVVYLYFPEESEVQDHQIYSVVRHPAYMAGVILGISAMFFRCSLYSIALFIIVYAVFRIHIRREEAELIDRFGEGYRDYREKVPGLYVRPRDLKSFVKFIMMKHD
jgi:protein-S-isoprenylcysteine O-methyltransferase Ste14